MNENKTTSKYIEWDLEKFKSGWPAEWHGKPAKFVAHVPEAKPFSRLFWLKDRDVYAGNPSVEDSIPKLLARELDPHQCNKDGLYRDQVGEGWRIKGHNEEPKDGDEFWSESLSKWVRWRQEFGALCADHTYRTRDPLLATKVDLGPEDIILGRTVARHVSSTVEQLVSTREPEGIGTSRQKFITWPILRDHYDISFDHGVTWQRAEKEAKP